MYFELDDWCSCIDCESNFEDTIISISYDDFEENEFDQPNFIFPIVRIR